MSSSVDQAFLLRRGGKLTPNDPLLGLFSPQFREGNGCFGTDTGMLIFFPCIALKTSELSEGSGTALLFGILIVNGASMVELLGRLES